MRSRTDLATAINTLEDAIRRIDRETREQLQETYDTVNRHFGELFPQLFGGGEARLILTGDEILDAGIQIMAQPPGKKNSTIHLLSGGEKALTAIALVFAMFQLNPAPFCMLDEVDAPLDDCNTERFCEHGQAHVGADPVRLHHPQQDRHGNGAATDRRHHAGAGRFARGRSGYRRGAAHDRKRGLSMESVTCKLP